MISFRAETLLEEARRTTGLDDFLEDGFREGLENLVETYRRIDTSDDRRQSPELATDQHAGDQTQARRSIAPASRDPERDVGSPLT